MGQPCSSPTTFSHTPSFLHGWLKWLSLQERPPHPFLLDNSQLRRTASLTKSMCLIGVRYLCSPLCGWFSFNCLLFLMPHLHCFSDRKWTFLCPATIQGWWVFNTSLTKWMNSFMVIVFIIYLQIINLQYQEGKRNLLIMAHFTLAGLRVENYSTGHSHYISFVLSYHNQFITVASTFCTAAHVQPCSTAS